MRLLTIMGDRGKDSWSETPAETIERINDRLSDFFDFASQLTWEDWITGGLLLLLFLLARKIGWLIVQFITGALVQRPPEQTLAYRFGRLLRNRLK